MTLETFYFVAQIIAALAIIASLIFVGIQIRAYTREQRLIAANMRNEKLVALMADLSKDPGLRDIVRRGSDSLSNLSADEAAAFSAHCTRICGIASEILTHRDLGAINDRVWENYKVSLRRFARSNGGREWWRLEGRTTIAPYPAKFLEELFDPPDEPARQTEDRGHGT